MGRNPALLLMLTATGCGSAEGSDQAVPAPRWAATGVGRVDGLTETRQLAASADGIIQQVHVARGDSIAAGQLLLTIDCQTRHEQARSRAAEAEQASAQARTVALGSRSEEVAMARQSIAEQEAARDEASQRLRIGEALGQRGFMSLRDIEARRNALAGAEARLASARSQTSLALAGPRVSEKAAAAAAARAAQAQARAASALASQCRLRSPIDGQVLQIFRREGEFSNASQGTPLIAVGDMTRLAVRAEINEREAARLSIGQPADVWIEGESKRWRGKIVQLAHQMGRRSARSLDPTDRFDRDTREAIVAFDKEAPPPLAGLRVMVGVLNR